MSAAMSPASAMAARDDSAVSSSPGIPVLRPIREIPIPEMIAPCSTTSLTPEPYSGPMTEVAPRIVPILDELNREFWTSGASGVLRITRCQSCRRWVFPLSLECPDCDGQAAYEATSGRGTVYTHTTNAHSYNPAVPVPYNISIVELVEQEGLRFTTNVVDCPPDEVYIGMPVRVQFEQNGEVFVPVFGPDRRR